MIDEVNYMTDERFKTYNQLPELLDEIIETLPEDKKQAGHSPICPACTIVVI